MNTNDEKNQKEELSREQMMKMQSLREMISTAEKTIQSAKAMLLQLEGKKKVGRHRKLEDEEGGSVIQGTFDGQLMLGSDGKQYPVPANYASKSKLVEGDLLKLHITPEGSFIYKQIGPVERKHALGIVTQDEGGNYCVIADGKAYKILLASITYFKAQPGDESAIVTSRDIDSHWASLENIVQKAKYLPEEVPLPEKLPSPSKRTSSEKTKKAESSDDFLKEWRSGIEKTQKEIVRQEKTSQTKKSSNSVSTKKTPPKKSNKTKIEDSDDLLEEWRADIEAIEKEIAESENKNTATE